MAEFFAIHQTDASLLGCTLRSLVGRVSLGQTEPAAGVGFFQNDDVLVRKRPLAGQVPLPERLAEGVESEAAIISSGAVVPSARFSEEMTLPFRFKRWLFAIAGQPEALAPTRPALVAALPEYLRRAAKGESAAESLFLAFLGKLREAGRLDDMDVDAETAARALAAAVGEAERACEKLGQALPALSVTVSNGRVLGALRRGHPLHVGTIGGLLTCARCEIGPGASNLDPRVGSHRGLRASLVVSGAQPSLPDGFRAVNDGEILALSRDLSVRSL